MPDKSPQLLIMSGPSGVGKNTVIDSLRQLSNDYSFVPTVTTRATRPAEKDGVDYQFVSLKEFQTMRDDGRLLEHAEVYGKFYGSPKQGVLDVLQSGRHAILRLDLQGAQAVYRQLPKAVLTVFILPPSVEAVLARLQARNMNAGQDLNLRWRSAAAEIVGYYTFPERHLVYNYDGDATAAARRIDALVKARAADSRSSVLDELKRL